MRLLSCHIENYGNISDTDFVFEPFLTEFLSENGTGKTTLASFIKAMFYGLPIVRKGSKFNDRQHYYPFNGKKFGGNILFLLGKDEYRIERFFDRTSGAKDRLTVYCNGAPMEAFGVEPGKRIFGLDAESFERTVFLTSDEIEIGTTGDISAKLGRFVDGTDENCNFDTAIKVLDQAAKELKASRGKNDLMTRQREKINRLKAEIVNLNGMSEEIGRLYRERKEVSEEIVRLSELEKDVGKQEILLQKWETYDTYEDSLARSKERKSQMMQKYPDGLPQEEELSEIENQIADAKILRIRVKELREKKPSMRQQELIRTFEQRVPSVEEREKLSECIRQYQERTSEQSPMTFQNVSNQKEHGKNLVLILSLVGLFLMVGGFALVFSDLLNGGILLGMGFFVILLCVFLYWRMRKAKALRMRREEERFKRETAELKAKIEHFLSSYGYGSRMGIPYDFAAFEKDYKEYETFCNELLAREEWITKNEQKLQEMLKHTEPFFTKYKMEPEMERSSFLAKLRSDKAEYEQILNNITYLEKTAVAYKEKQELMDRPDEPNFEFDTLQGELDKMRSRLAAVDREIASIERELERLTEKQNELMLAEEVLEEYLDKYEIYTSTLKVLKVSEQNLRDKYIEPTKEQFLKYAKVLEQTLGEKVTIAKDLKIFYERGGENRTEKHLSAGQRSICQLCFRLALMEQMFEKEKPFLIMDDPFTGLDAFHMGKVAQLLNELAKERQIIYFSCHESRKLNGI